MISSYSKKQAAFTLFEVLIALIIFAILGLMIALGLRRTLESNKRANDADQRIQKLEIAQALLRRDIMAIVDRPITDNNGQKLPAVLLKADEIDFTRGGVINPFYTGNRSDLQRIEYTYRDGNIVRSIWPTLDRMSGTAPSSMILLSHVSNFSIEVYDDQNRLQPAWPYNVNANTLTTNTVQQTDLPRAVHILFTIKGQGSIEDTIPIVSRGLTQVTNEIPNDKTKSPTR